MNHDQFTYLVKVASVVAAYKLEQVDEMLSRGKTVALRNRRQRSNEIKKRAALYMATKDAQIEPQLFGLSKSSQWGESPNAAPTGVEPPAEGPGPAPASPPSPALAPASGTDPLSPALGMPSGDTGNPNDDNMSLPPDVAQFLSGKLVELESFIKDFGRNAWKMDLSQPDVLRVVKETVKVMSNKVADVPIQAIIDKIDDYLDKVEKAAPDVAKQKSGDAGAPKPAPGEGADGPSAEGVAPGPSAPGAPTATEAMPKTSSILPPQQRKTTPPWK